MVCPTGFVWVQQGVELYKRRATGEGPTFLEIKRTRVSCKECRGAMTESSLRYHIERLHGIVLSHIREVEFRGRGPDTYKVLLPRILNSVECPVGG